MILRFKKSDLLAAIGFLLSFLRWETYAIFLLGLLFYRREYISGNIKALLLIAVRTVIGPAVAASIGSAQYIKWIVIFFLSFDILLSIKPFRFDTKVKKTFAFFLTVFIVTNMIATIANSSYPVVSLFKLVSYVIPFYAVMTGVSKSRDRVDWIEYLINVLTWVMLACLVVIPFDSYRTVNEDFQGIIEHPNMMGVMAAIYIGLLVYKLGEKGFTYRNTIMLALSFVMIYLSKSRTAMFSSIVFCVIALLLCERLNVKEKAIGFVLIAAAVALLLFFNREWLEYITDFIYKRGNEDILASRREQEEDFLYKFKHHFLFGAGFMVPFAVGLRNYSLSFNVGVEPGNLYYAILGDSGVFGAIAFLGYYLTVLVSTPFKKWVLLFIPIVLSLGEMSFYSTNSIALIYYTLIGVCYHSKEQRRRFA